MTNLKILVFFVNEFNLLTELEYMEHYDYLYLHQVEYISLH
jgi:hypothetical protein